jgi:hypothetical protein
VTVLHDIPPAGTECYSCRVLGHFCKAVAYANATSDAGICQACVDGRECEQVAARRITFSYEEEDSNRAGAVRSLLPGRDQWRKAP